MMQTLDQLSAAATEGEWVADNHVITLSPATTVACLVNYNQFGDEFPIVNEEADAAFIVALVNAYRTGQLVAVADDAVERVARAMCEAVGKNPDKMTPAPRGAVGMVPLWTLWKSQAKAAIAAMKDTQP